jgi:hypothetical protein
LALKLIARDINDIEPLSPNELRELSPLLESGGYSRGDSAPTFIGRVVSSAWGRLPVDERRAAARQIREALSRRHIRAAFITVDGTPAIHIADAELVTVQ